MCADPRILSFATPCGGRSNAKRSAVPRLHLFRHLWPMWFRPRMPNATSASPKPPLSTACRFLGFVHRLLLSFVKSEPGLSFQVSAELSVRSLSVRVSASQFRGCSAQAGDLLALSSRLKMAAASAGYADAGSAAGTVPAALVAPLVRPGSMSAGSSGGAGRSGGGSDTRSGSVDSTRSWWRFAGGVVRRQVRQRAAERSWPRMLAHWRDLKRYVPAYRAKLELAQGKLRCPCVFSLVTQR